MIKLNIKKLMVLGFVFLLLLSINIHAETYNFPKYSESHGSISLGFGSLKDEVDPAIVYNIDGIDIKERDHYIALSPGKHILLCRARFDLNDYNHKIPKGQHFKNTVLNNTLEIIIQAGKKYFVGYSTKNIDIQKWKPVVFKVTD